MRRTIVVLLSAVLLLALGVPQAAAADAQVVISGDVNVPRGSTVGDIVVVDGSVDVAGRVDGDVIAVSGPVRVAGTVDGSISAVSDRVTLLPGARVTGDVRYGDERPAIARSAKVGGEVSDEGWSELADFPWGAVGAVGWWLAVSISTLVLGLVLLALAPRAADAAVDTARTRLGVSLAWGAGLFFGLPLVAVVALITLIGFPLGLGLLLALIPLAGLGYVTTAYLLGRVLLKDAPGRIASFLVGWGLLRVAAIVPFLGVLAWLAAIVVGLGVLLVTLWRTRAPAVGPAPAGSGRVPTGPHSAAG
jgi:hypothetical protein